MLRRLSFQTSRIAGLIHRLNNGVPSLSFHDAVENFSLQLLHQRIIYSPRGFFQIDFLNMVSVRL